MNSESFNSVDELINDENIDNDLTQFFNEKYMNINKNEQITKKANNNNNNDTNQPSRKFFKTSTNRIPKDNSSNNKKKDDAFQLPKVINKNYTFNNKGNNRSQLQSISSKDKNFDIDLYLSNDDLTDLISQIDETQLNRNQTNQSKSTQLNITPLNSTSSSSASLSPSYDSLKQSDNEFIKTVSSLPERDNKNYQTKPNRPTKSVRQSYKNKISRILEIEKEMRAKSHRNSENVDNQTNKGLLIDDLRKEMIEINKKNEALNFDNKMNIDGDDSDEINEEYRSLLSNLKLSISNQH